MKIVVEMDIEMLKRYNALTVMDGQGKPISFEKFCRDSVADAIANLEYLNPEQFYEGARKIDEVLKDEPEI